MNAQIREELARRFQELYSHPDGAYLIYDVKRGVLNVSLNENVDIDVPIVADRLFDLGVAMVELAYKLNLGAE